MSFAKEFQQIFATVKEIIDTKHVKDQVLDDARKFAVDTVTKVLEHSDEPFPDFARIDLVTDDDRDEFLLVLDFLQCTNNVFGVPVLSFESQHPDVKCDRAQLAAKLGLSANSPEPLLFQMMRSHERWLQEEE